jgi:flagellar biosynthesis protein
MDRANVAKDDRPNSPSRPSDAQQVAVALDSDHGRRRAPKVIAKGRGAVAEQILQIAFDRGVKVRSDADLAEILGAVELESEIPLEALAAVAEILSYVYRVQADTAGEQGQP